MKNKESGKKTKDPAPSADKTIPGTKGTVTIKESRHRDRKRGIR